MIPSFWHMSDISALFFLMSANNTVVSGRYWLFKRIVVPSEAKPPTLIQTSFDIA